MAILLCVKYLLMYLATTILLSAFAHSQGTKMLWLFTSREVILFCIAGVPVYYAYHTEDGRSVNGSSTGSCNTSECTDSTQFLADGVVPTLHGLDGDMWASQLLTLQTRALSVNITLRFNTSSDYIGEQNIEVVMFNCPQWGISAQTIRLLNAAPTSGSGSLLSVHNLDPALVSCHSFVRVCVAKRVSSTPTVTLQFDLGLHSNWIHIAEVTFLNGRHTTCLPDAILLTPTTKEDKGIL